MLEESVQRDEVSVGTLGAGGLWHERSFGSKTVVALLVSAVKKSGRKQSGDRRITALALLVSPRTCE